MTKVLRQLYTRDGRLVPVIDSKAHTGYNYPMLSEHYHNGNTPEMYKLLQSATEREYLRPKFIDKLHLCSNCYSAFINFRETCPKCESTDLVTENLIHHFVCAYVGPEHDFLSGDYMVCPKCNRLLRHIGVDYDKPSLIYNCRNCSNLFQEPVMEAFCFSCHKRNPVEALIDMPVYSYELTAIGEETAQNGFSRDVKEEFELPGYITFTTFNIFLKYEIERSKTTNKVSAVGSLILRISNSDKEKMGAGYRKLITEVSDFIKNATLSTDILSFINNNTFLVISPDTDPAKLQTLLQNIQSSVNKLLANSLPGLQIGFVPKVLSINANQNHTDMINQLLTV
jgi:RNA polymerase subunit RPABC4/transcription elongation factor Spt4